MAALPTGTVTFLFTDVESSTTLLLRLGPEAYAGELDLHRHVLREIFAAYNGVEVDTAGDSFFVAFSRAVDAVAAAREAQAGLEAGTVGVRMGLHTGEPLVTGSGYVGLDVHRAARISAAGHGGQVLISHATRSLVEDGEFLDLGEHRLKDLTRPERIYQLGTAKFPPLKSLNRTNLPVAAHPLVGRAAEQEELAAALRQHRWSRSAARADPERHGCASDRGGGPGRVRRWRVLRFPREFADPNLVVPAVVQVLDLAEPEALQRSEALIVLDNFEHVLSAAPDLARLLADAPGLRLLVTSRIPLRLSAEVEYPLHPLPQEAAVEMFLHRAQLIHQQIEPSETINSICRRLDGLPLALELAAARLQLLDPVVLLDRLNSRLPLLTQGSHDLPERHRTLEATIAWSYDLLTPRAQELFRHLSVFEETFGIDAAEQVAGADLDTLTTLVDASLVKPIGESRFLVLGTLREFAAGRSAAGERAELEARHVAHYFQLAERAEPELTSRDAALWLARLDADHPNLRAALDSLGRSKEAVRLTLALWRFWFVRGHFEEANTRLRHALELDVDGARRAETLYKLGAIVLSRGDTTESARLFSEALILYRSIGDRRGEARALTALGHAEGDDGEWELARDYYERAAALWRELDDEPGVADVLNDLASLLVRAGQAAQALAIAEEAVELQRRLGHEQGLALGMATLAYACIATGDFERARPLLVESTRLAHRLGYQHGLVYCLNGLGLLAFECDDPERAALAFGAAHRRRREIGIENDADDVLVAHARTAIEERLGSSVDGGDGPELDLVEFAAAATLS